MAHLRPEDKIVTRRQAWIDIVERSAIGSMETALGLLIVDGVFISLPEGATWSTIAVTAGVTFLWNVVRRYKAVFDR